MRKYKQILVTTMVGLLFAAMIYSSSAAAAEKKLIQPTRGAVSDRDG